MLADDYGKRVMIVDTSNEIGGDGDIPHAGIGSARRMQVPNSDMQHEVLAQTLLGCYRGMLQRKECIQKRQFSPFPLLTICFCEICLLYTSPSPRD